MVFYRNGHATNYQPCTEQLGQIRTGGGFVVIVEIDAAGKVISAKSDDVLPPTFSKIAQCIADHIDHYLPSLSPEARTPGTHRVPFRFTIDQGGAR